MTSNDFVQSTVDYWTPERMANAQPKDALVVDQELSAWSLSHHPLEPRSDVLERSIPATAPFENVTKSSMSSESRSTTPRVSGKAFFVMNGRNYLCSGSVVVASNRDTVITAGHCVYDYELQMWASRWVFIPQYNNGSALLGTWVARRLTTLSNWGYYQDYNSDAAIVLMHADSQGKHIQQFTGGLGIKFNGNKQVNIHAFGFPKNMLNGEMMSICTGLTFNGLGIVPRFNGVYTVCGMTGGSSGGPWIQEYDTETMLGQQMSLTSFMIINRPGILFGPYFNTDIYNMYKQYEIL
ncbi:unnamed protein product [Rotaria sp. Silwood1]|nr:unnamed protein product [Rotaria sp. Silwood1]CAF3750348.1 unnamed protein product [Rotaria sp. Silwood1]CAF3976465.1 unnamed protein product [Rotaria sp. Silwood1]CAF4528538.1 unnamed protein product [Rotaria sp. Silwood1]CAF4535371.1 unnamed protein product [Rotaria sp. Silwood1]